MEKDIATNDSSTEDSEENSATEISTDSEFEHDGTTPTQHEIPEITINDSFVRKTRGNYLEPKKVQVKSRIITSINGNTEKNNESSNRRHQFTKQQQQNIKLNALNEACTPKSRNGSKELHSNANSTQNSRLITPTPFVNPRKGDYLLNRTHSTEGIASKLSLELKKRYLLGGSGFGGSVVKSVSTSNVDTRLRNLSDAISQHQKLLNPAPEPSPTMQAFLQGTNKLRPANQQSPSPLSPSTLFGASSPIKAFPFDRKSATENDVTVANLSNTKNNQLPDLIKESSNLKEPDFESSSKSTVLEKKPLSVELLELKKKPDFTVLKMDTPTPTNEVKIITESKTPIQFNGESIPCDCQDRESDEPRPRSPLHETSIVVPQVDWKRNKKVKTQEDDDDDDDESSEDSDELDSDSLSSSDVDDPQPILDRKATTSLSPPRLQIHSTDGDLLLDEQVERRHEDILNFEPDSIECSCLIENTKGIDCKISLPAIPSIPRACSNEVETVSSNMKQLQLVDETNQRNFSGRSSPNSLISHHSSKNDDSEDNDLTTAAYTETEFSEWAKDGDDLVSEDLRDVEYNMNSEFRDKNRRPYDGKVAGIANGEDLTDIELDYSQEELEAEKTNAPYPSTIASKLLSNGEDIGYMDTDNDSLLEEDSLKEIWKPKNRGYIEFVNIKTPTSNVIPCVAPIARSELEYEESSDAQTPCSEDANTNIIEFAPVTMDDVRDRLRLNIKTIPCEIKITKHDEGKTSHEGVVEAMNKELMCMSMDEDSLLIIEPAEDTTTSEVVTILASPIKPENVTENGDDRDTHSDTTKISDLTRAPELSLKPNEDVQSPDYLEYVKRLQSRIAEFSNVKDSIDVRKSKRKGSKLGPPTPRSDEIITEEAKPQQPEPISSGLNSPATSRKLEELTRERSKQKTLIQDLLMDKLEAHKQRSAEKKAKRAARSASFKGPSTTLKRVPSPIVIPMRPSEISLDTNSNGALTPVAPSSPPEDNDVTMMAPVAPPRLKHEEARQDARQRARLKSDEDLGLSPEDRMKELRMKLARRQLKSETDAEIPAPRPAKRCLRSSFGLHRPTGKLQTSKSTDSVTVMAQQMNGNDREATAKSLDELLTREDGPVHKRDKSKRSKEPDRRRSIIQAVSDFFKRKDSLSPTSATKDTKLSMFRLTPKSKDKSRLEKINSQFNKRPKSVCEGMLNVGSFFIESPPPVPPPPINYTMPTNVTDESLSEDDSKTTALSSSQLNKNLNVVDGSCNSIPRKAKTAKRIARQAQLKRLRMAQEIQRKLEETEVKQRELESRGVSVEKALRGEGECSDREEADLLREWFDLMRERTELRRYEKELLVRAQEVQLEDRHDRLQQELRERLADDDDKKTSADVKKEGEILTEMLEIVAKRDSLIALLEEERQRYQDEDRDLEVQMLSKDIRFTSVNKRGSKYSV